MTTKRKSQEYRHDKKYGYQGSYKQWAFGNELFEKLILPLFIILLPFIFWEYTLLILLFLGLVLVIKKMLK